MDWESSRKLQRLHSGKLKRLQPKGQVETAKISDALLRALPKRLKEAARHSALSIQLTDKLAVQLRVAGYAPQTNSIRRLQS